MSDSENKQEIVTRSKTKNTVETKGETMSTENMESLLRLLTAKFDSEVGTRGIETSLPEFDGEMNIKTWLANFEANAETYKWNKMQKFVFATNKMTKTAKLFLQTVTITNYEELKRKLLEEFDKEYNSADIHEQLRHRVKKEGETFNEYVLKMRQLGATANIDNVSVIRYIVDGIKGKSEFKMGMYSARDFKELKRQHEIFERLDNGKKQHESKRSDDKNKKHCFNCGSTEHRRSDCKVEGPKCFRCNKFGHISKNCTIEREKNVALNTVQHKKNMMKAVIINNTPMLCLVDTGAEVSLVKNAIAVKWNASIQKYNSMIAGLGGKIVPIGSLEVDIVVDGIKTRQNFIVVEDNVISFEVVIGYDITSQFRYTSDENGYTFTSLIRTDELYPIAMTLEVENEYIVPSKYEKQVKELIENHKPKVKEVECPISMKITVLTDKKIQHLPKRTSPAEREIISNQIKEWLDRGIIRTSSSNYCSRLVIVKKKDGAYRICVDFRDLNKIVEKDRFPVPTMEEVIDEIRSSKVFSVIDLENAYFHVPIEEESRKFTGFTCREGTYEFNKAPFGFCNSPAVFLRYINYIFKNLINESVVQVYMDDIIVYSLTEEEGIENLKKVFAVAAEHGLKIKWKKCKFLQRMVSFLGFILEDGSVRPDENKVSAIRNFPEPKSTKDVQSFLGLTGFFRKFVAEYAMIVAPLNSLLKKDAVFKMGIEQQTAVARIKYVLTNKPVLKIFSLTADTELHCDASKEGFGAVLLQKFEYRWHPVYYWSKKSSDEDKRRHSYHLEIKAAFLAIKRLKCYLWGKEFKLVTDCQAFKCTMSKTDLVPAVARWVLYIQEFRYTIEHRKANSLKHADALSRYPVVMTIRPDISLRIKRAQEEDDHIRAIKQILLNQPYEDYKVIGDIMYKQRQGMNLVVIPKRMEVEIIRNMHERGHFGAEKTQHLIEQEYFIPHVRGKIDNLISNCVRCILFNKKLGKKEGYLHPIEKGEKPLSDIHMDHLGPMDNTSKMYKYMLTVVDSFSKFVWIYPTKTTTAEETLRKMNEWTKIFGAPQRIISDRGTAFTANIFKDWCAKEHIDHVLTTTGVARGNGQVERINRTILNILSKVSADKPEAWYKHVHKVQKAINSTVNRTTSFSPFELMFGVRMKNDIDKALNTFLQQELLNTFVAERSESRQIARNQILAAQKSYKQQFDKKRKEEKLYSEGDLVAVKRTQFIAGKKLASEYMGPYKVVKCKRQGRYDVCKVGDVEGPQRTATTCDFMKPWPNHNNSTDLSETDNESDGRM